MRLFYNLAVSLGAFLLYLLSSAGGRLGAFVRGRRGLIGSLQYALKAGNSPLIWVHCPSLGEFEQGRPVLEALRKNFNNHRILLTFFSPSGYEIRKDYAQADVVTYLPLDTPWSVRRFVQVANPRLVILVKYDFWPNLLFGLERAGAPVVAISAIFRPDHFYFRWYGSFFLQALQTIDRFFVQDEDSARLLRNHGITGIEVTGDTRFDRVVDITDAAQPVPEVEAFISGHDCWVIGSAWPEDMAVIGERIASNDGNERFIVVPHEVGEESLKKIERYCSGRSVRWSALASGAESCTVMIIDRIGMLSRLYRYATYAWVGGAYGKGLHNTLEAAAYGVPVFFGNRNYRKFREAVELITKGGAWTIGSHAELEKITTGMKPGTPGYRAACDSARNYVLSHTGATKQIVDWCSKLLAP